MRQLTYIAPGKVEWQDVAEPTLDSPHAALVRPIAVATCDLDAAVVRGAAPVPAPFALGHEFIADVIETGDAVRDVAPGDRVIVPFQISCGVCGRCRRGLTASCEEVNRNAMYGLGKAGGNWGGALSDVVRVPYADAMLVKVPSGIEARVIASISDNLSDGWRAVAPYLGEMPDAPVLIIGGGMSGSIGLYAVAIAHALGASRIDYVDTDPTRLAKAQELGANPIDKLPKRFSPAYPITVDSSSNPDGLACALRSTEPEGVCTSTGIYYAPTTPVPLLEMYTNGIIFKTGRVNSRAVFPHVLELVQSERLHPEAITSHYAAWDDAPDAITAPFTKLIIMR